MSYLGKVDMNDANIKHYSLTGSTLTTVNIGWTPASEQSLRVTINGVVQQGDTFSYSGANLTLGGPLIVTDTLEVVGIQSVGNIITPADNSVSTAKLADDAVTLAKMAGGTDGNLITYDASGNPAYVATGSATNVLTSNGAGAAPTFQAAAAGVNTPYFYAYLVTDFTAISDNTWTKVPCNTVSFETGTTYDETTNFRWTPAVAGKYFLYGQIQCRADTANKLQRANISIYKNGSDAGHTVETDQPENTLTYSTPTISAILDLNATDYVELWGLIDTYSGNRRFYGNVQATRFMGYKLID